MDDPHARLRDAVLQRVLDGPGQSDPALRHAAADGTGLPADLQPLVERIQAHAWRVTDDDVQQVRRAYGDDRTFELIVAASLGASRKRLLAGLRALEDA